MANELGNAPATATPPEAEEMDRSPNPEAKDYGCTILLEDTELEKVKDKSFPTDARIVRYKKDDRVCMDLTRARKVVDIFDFYYDKYGPGSVQGIDFGYGAVNPKLWGYKKTEEKKKK